MDDCEKMTAHIAAHYVENSVADTLDVDVQNLAIVDVQNLAIEFVLECIPVHVAYSNEMTNDSSVPNAGASSAEAILAVHEVADGEVEEELGRSLQTH